MSNSQDVNYRKNGSKLFGIFLLVGFTLNVIVFNYTNIDNGSKLKMVSDSLEKYIEPSNEYHEDMKTNQEPILNAPNNYNSSNQVTKEGLEWVKHVIKMLFKMFQHITIIVSSVRYLRT